MRRLGGGGGCVYDRRIALGNCLDVHTGTPVTETF